MTELMPVLFRPDMSERRFRHKKRGTTYQILTDSASLQCSAAPDFENLFADDCFTVYQNVATGAVYVRPTPEFFDGRFEELPRDPTPIARSTVCAGGIDPGFDECPKCGATMDESCKFDDPAVDDATKAGSR